MMPQCEKAKLFLETLSRTPFKHELPAEGKMAGRSVTLEKADAVAIPKFSKFVMHYYGDGDVRQRVSNELNGINKLPDTVQLLLTKRAAYWQSNDDVPVEHIKKGCCSREVRQILPQVAALESELEEGYTYAKLFCNGPVFAIMKNEFRDAKRRAQEHRAALSAQSTPNLQEMKECEVYIKTAEDGLLNLEQVEAFYRDPRYTWPRDVDQKDQ